MADGQHSPVNVYLSVGSNIEPEQHIRMACRELSSDFGALELSSVYRNEAVGFKGGDFLNMVIGLSTHEQPEQVVTRLERLHDRAGRKRHSEPFSSRTLDLDLLLYGDLVQHRLNLPRADIEKYSFVLGPLAELAPELKHPVTGVSMSDIWGDFDHGRHPLERVELAIE
jgi:2-amino-4-hydroxy-6-hydroxymethyldihydropteridine diphosphokinase